MEFISGLIVGLIFKSLNIYTQRLRETSRVVMANLLEGTYLVFILLLFWYFYLG